jgi:BarA-like signal transduction histidine kinase
MKLIEEYFAAQLATAEPLTEEAIELLQSKTMSNGTPWKIGDVMLFAIGMRPQTLISFNKEALLKESSWRNFYPPAEHSVLPITVM